MKFIFSKSEHPIFENFLESMPPGPLNSLGPTLEFNFSIEKSGNFIPSGNWTPCVFNDVIFKPPITVICKKSVAVCAMEFASNNYCHMTYADCHATEFQVIPDHGNHQKKWTLLKSYLLEFE